MWGGASQLPQKGVESSRPSAEIEAIGTVLAHSGNGPFRKTLEGANSQGRKASSSD